MSAANAYARRMHRLCASILLLGSFACRERADATRNPPAGVVAVPAPSASASVEDEDMPAELGLGKADDAGAPKAPKVQWGSAPLDPSGHAWRDALRDQYGVH